MLQYKEDWKAVQKRYSAWWEGEELDTPIIQITSPRGDATEFPRWDEWALVHNLDSSKEVYAGFESYCKKTFFGGDAYPGLWLNTGPGAMGGFLGNTPVIREDTVWYEEPDTWENILEKLSSLNKNDWFHTVMRLTEEATKTGNGKFIAGTTDLGGNLDILASLRGSQNSVFDLIDSPGNVKTALQKINDLWFEYYDLFDTALQRYGQGYSTWMPIWSETSWYPLQCDFSAMISPVMFEEFVAPYLQQQCRFLSRSIYHWDGPGAIPHLDVLLDIPELGGFQWTPGDGNPRMESPKWYHLYKQIQDRGKLLVLLDIKAERIEELLKHVRKKGLLIRTECKTQQEAEDLLNNIKAWCK